MKQPAVRAVIFDLGKVLVDFDYAIAVQKIAARGKLSVSELTELISRSPLHQQYETGLLSTEQFYAQVRGATGYNGDLDEFSVCFGDIFAAIEPMVQVQAKLRQGGIPTYIFSNTNELAVRHIRRTFPFFSNFDGYILSYEHGAMKPDHKLYQVVERQAGRRGVELLYLDDRPENLATGVARGWQVILHESPQKSREAIQELGLLDGRNLGA